MSFLLPAQQGACNEAGEMWPAFMASAYCSFEMTLDKGVISL